MITCAKGLTNGTIPMGAVFVRKGIYDTFMEKAPEGAIELFHGYTYSGHPVACAAGVASLEIYQEEGLFERANALAGYWEDAVHSLQGRAARHRPPQPRPDRAASSWSRSPARSASAPSTPSVKAYEDGLLIRVTGDIIALSPPLIVEKNHIDEMFDKLGKVLKTVD